MSEYIDIRKLKGHIRKEKAKRILRKIGSGLKVAGRGIGKGYQKSKPYVKKAGKQFGEYSKEVGTHLFDKARKYKYSKDFIGLNIMDNFMGNNKPKNIKKKEKGKKKKIIGFDSYF